jgi:hypothetical protein
VARLAGIALALLLGGLAAAAAQSEAEPPYRQIIAQNLKTMFFESAKPRGMSVSTRALRVTTAAGPAWGACLRGSFTSMADRPLTRTYVIVFKRNEIVDRRAATPADGCDKQRYEPVAAR